MHSRNHLAFWPCVMETFWNYRQFVIADPWKPWHFRGLKGVKKAPPLSPFIQFYALIDLIFFYYIRPHSNTLVRYCAKIRPKDEFITQISSLQFLKFNCRVWAFNAEKKFPLSIPLTNQIKRLKNCTSMPIFSVIPTWKET